MRQLIIEGIALPEARNDNYKCYPHDETMDIRAISGRLYTEKSYTFVVIEYSFDYLKDEIRWPLQELLRSNTSLGVSYLPDDSNELRHDFFKCTKHAPRNYAFSRGGKAYWHGISFTLEGVNPLA